MKRVFRKSNKGTCLCCGRSLEGKQANAKYCNRACKKQERERRLYIGTAYSHFNYFKTAKEQNNLCAICHRPETRLRKNGMPRRLDVDHNHQTGEIRKLLCNNCNRLVGIVEPRGIVYVKALLEYLQNFDTNNRH